VIAWYTDVQVKVLVKGESVMDWTFFLLFGGIFVIVVVLILLDSYSKPLPPARGLTRASSLMRSIMDMCIPFRFPCRWL
jgi:hypothetical protein